MTYDAPLAAGEYSVSLYEPDGTCRKLLARGKFAVRGGYVTTVQLDVDGKSVISSSKPLKR